MKLIIGLGNPEDRYTNTRHNVGFSALDSYAQQHELEFIPKDKFRALIAEYSADSEKIILVKPTTYYNDSGEAARAIADFYKVEQADILIIHDELALPFGTIRTRFGGSDAGNNGVKSINAHLGPDTARIRVGVYNETRSATDDANFVLSKFSKNEHEQLQEILLPRIQSLIDTFIQGNFDHTTHK